MQAHIPTGLRGPRGPAVADDDRPVARGSTDGEGLEDLGTDRHAEGYRVWPNHIQAWRPGDRLGGRRCSDRRPRQDLEALQRSLRPELRPPLSWADHAARSGGPDAD